MSETETRTEVDVEGFDKFSIVANAYRCRFIISSKGGQLTSEFALDRHIVFGMIDEIDQSLIGHRTRVFVREVSIIQLSETPSGWVLSITLEQARVSILLKNKNDLGKFVEALKLASDWDPSMSDLIPAEVSKYLKKTDDEITKDIVAYIKNDLQSEDKLALFDIDSLDDYFNRFWKERGAEWYKIGAISKRMDEKIEKIEQAVSDTLSDATIRAQDGLVDSLSREIVNFCRENRLDRVSKKNIDQVLDAKKLTLPERIKQRLYARSNSRLFARRE